MVKFKQIEARDMKEGHLYMVRHEPSVYERWHEIVIFHRRENGSSVCYRLMAWGDLYLPEEAYDRDYDTIRCRNKEEFRDKMLVKETIPYYKNDTVYKVSCEVVALFARRVQWLCELLAESLDKIRFIQDTIGICHYNGYTLMRAASDHYEEWECLNHWTALLYRDEFVIDLRFVGGAYESADIIKAVRLDVGVFLARAAKMSYNDMTTAPLTKKTDLGVTNLVTHGALLKETKLVKRFIKKLGYVYE